MTKMLPWCITALAAVVSFGLVLTKVGTPQIVENSARLWMLLGLAWLVAFLLGVGTVRCFDGLFSPLDDSMSGYKLIGWVSLETGLVGALCMAMAWSWGASQVGQLSYARHVPEESLSEDMERVLAALTEQCEESKTRPESMKELVRLIVQEKVVLRYTWIREGVWLDPWGRSIRYQSGSGEEEPSCDLVLYSIGPNGVDENRDGDDIVHEYSLPEPTDL